jgi:predicted Zn-dependent protease
MITRTNLFAMGIASLLALSGTGLVAHAPARAMDTTETTAAKTEPDFATAKTLVDTGKYDEALSALQALDARTPNNPDVLNLIGYSLRKTGYTDVALLYYTRALALKPDHLGANEYLGELYLELRQPAKAERQLEILRRACRDCEEFRDLREKIAQTAEAN